MSSRGVLTQTLKPSSLAACTARLKRPGKNAGPGRSVPQRLKPSRALLFTARLKPCPSWDSLFHEALSVLSKSPSAPRARLQGQNANPDSHAAEGLPFCPTEEK